MRVLVTSGSGFIAKALIARLLQKDVRVSALTRNKARGLSPRSGVLDVYEADISDGATLKKLTIQDRVDVVVHLAASLDYFGDRGKLFRVNVDGTANLLDWALKNGVKKFVFISSIEAMGAVSEEAMPADEMFRSQPLSNYGESKLEAERLVEKFPGEKIILRLGNVYGPPSPALILPLADAILKQRRLLKLLPDYGERRVHPVFIDDAVNGIAKALMPGAPGSVFIIAGEKHVTIAELFAGVARGLGTTIEPRSGGTSAANALYLFFHVWLCRLRKRADLLAYFTAGSGGRIHRAYSIEKAARELGWRPAVGLKEGIAMTLEWAGQDGVRGG